MSKQSKFPGGGKVGNTAPGNVPKGTRIAASYSGADKAPIKSNIITERWAPGDSQGTSSVSSHNSINTFTRGIKSRGPHGGTNFSSFNNSKQDMQRSNTSAISSASTPSGSKTSFGRVASKLSVKSANDPMTSNRATKAGQNYNKPTRAGGSGKASGSSRKVGSGRVQATRQSSPKSNKNGSGYMASV